MVYIFTCPICRKLFSSDEPGEPCCTGPSETRDDNEMVVMRLLRVNREDVNPLRAEQRAMGELLMPHVEPEVLRRDSIIVVSR